MTPLLDFDALTSLCERAIDAGLAQPPRDALFLGFDAAVKAAIFSDAVPADALRIEIDRLNSYVDPTGTDDYLLAMWLFNAANKLDDPRPTDAAFFRGLATSVNAIPRPAPPRPDTAGNLTSGARAEEQTNPAVNHAVQILRASMSAMNRRATNLMVSKRMHDALHNIQLHIVPLWSAGVAALPVTPLAQQMVETQHRALRDKAEALPGEFGFLAPHEPLRGMAQETSDALLATVAGAEAALSRNDVEGLKTAIAKVRDIVKQSMPRYAGRMESYQEALDLSDLVKTLTRLSEDSTHQGLKANASRLASSLAAIVQDLSVIGPQHSQWQRLDLRLSSLETWFGFLNSGPALFSSFNLEWEAANADIESLESQSPTDRFDRVKHLRETFLQICPVPVQASPSQEATKPFGDFIIETRTVFYRVDVRMKQICNQLREITNQLAQL